MTSADIRNLLNQNIGDRSDNNPYIITAKEFKERAEELYPEWEGRRSDLRQGRSERQGVMFDAYQSALEANEGLSVRAFTSNEGLMVQHGVPQRIVDTYSASTLSRDVRTLNGQLRELEHEVGYTALAE